MQVSSDGEIVFVFSPSTLRRELRAASSKARAKDTWSAVSPPLFWLLRASFGLALLTSITIVITGITALSQSRDEDNRGSSSSSFPMISRMWGPNPLDFLYYTQPYRYSDDPQDIGFLQSCFSFLFGDGDPNADLDVRTSQAVAALIRQVRCGVGLVATPPHLNSLRSFLPITLTRSQPYLSSSLSIAQSLLPCLPPLATSPSPTATHRLQALTSSILITCPSEWGRCHGRAARSLAAARDLTRAVPRGERTPWRAAERRVGPSSPHPIRGRAQGDG